MFNITEYNKILLFGIFIFVALVLIFLLKRKLTTIIDPLCFNIIWIAGHVAFLFAYMYKYGVEILPCFFLLNLFIYTLCLKSYRIPNKQLALRQKLILVVKEKEKKIKLLYFITLIFLLISKMDFFKYILENPSISSWVLYRFVDLQGRTPILRILGISSSIYFYFISFSLLFLIKKHRIIVSMVLIFLLIINMLAGGRSTLLSFFISLGLFVFYFHLSHLVKRINITGTIGIILSLFIAAIISSQYSGNSGISDGISTIVNRTAAVGDGLEYYMKYNGYENIKVGPYEYFMSIFGIYIKNIFGIKYQNIGTQLTALVKGEDQFFASGSNYTFLLQIMVIGYWLFFIYSPLIAYIVMKLRYNAFFSFQWLPFSYFLSSICFTIASDMEYAVLVLISGFLFYLFILYPILKIKLR
ncbi:MAG: oligosaccharide repeat unit polymerase [Prevotellaceae bacterium]|jgi:hypothetical protein|nr:oligosaccharide repeat unit polymerase [Prevotellaceae bacterium]